MRAASLRVKQVTEREESTHARATRGADCGLEINFANGREKKRLLSSFIPVCLQDT